MAFDRPLGIHQWGKEMKIRMEAKSNFLHGALRQDVPTSPTLVAKRRKAEAIRLAREQAGEDIK